MKRHTFTESLKLKDQATQQYNWRFLLDGAIWGLLMGIVIGISIFYLLQYQNYIEGVIK